MKIKIIRNTFIGGQLALKDSTPSVPDKLAAELIAAKKAVPLKASEKNGKKEDAATPEGAGGGSK